MQNLLQIVQAFTRRTGLPAPGAVYGNANAGIQQILALLEEVGEELVTRYNWQVLKKKASWTSTAATSQGSLYTLAGDDLERVLPNTLFDETSNDYFHGPIPLEVWTGYVNGLNTTSDTVFTVLGNELHVYPTPAAGDTYSFYYQSKKWVLGADGTTLRERFADDGDKPLFDDHLLKLGLRYKWKQEKGLPYAEEQRAFEAAALDKSSRDFTRPTLSMAGTPSVGPKDRPTFIGQIGTVDGGGP